jgi:hypothetical protein
MTVVEGARTGGDSWISPNVLLRLRTGRRSYSPSEALLPGRCPWFVTRSVICWRRRRVLYPHFGRVCGTQGPLYSESSFLGSALKGNFAQRTKRGDSDAMLNFAQVAESTPRQDGECKYQYGGNALEVSSCGTLIEAITRCSPSAGTTAQCMMSSDLIGAWSRRAARHFKDELEPSHVYNYSPAAGTLLRCWDGSFGEFCAKD